LKLLADLPCLAQGGKTLVATLIDDNTTINKEKNVFIP
jgi:hypothetical protein